MNPDERTRRELSRIDFEVTKLLGSVDVVARVSAEDLGLLLSGFERWHKKASDILCEQVPVVPLEGKA